ncbi:MAG: L-2-hydroxyglutarate oxidase [Deltaproteobacteria bacterium]|nr:L-2-hydroxyglutarate oxidase [Deltaproteobacteria bacterium]
MTSQRINDITIIGGGIVGISTALTILQKAPSIRLCVLEAENQLAAHQTGNNSGVIHSGLYYQPGSLKAHNCYHGRAKLLRFCDEENIPYELCGKIVVATQKAQLAKLNQLEQHAKQNGLAGVKPITADEIKNYEPHAAGIAGLYVPETGIIDFRQVVTAMAKRIKNAGGQIITNAKVIKIVRKATEIILVSKSGDYKTRAIINCAGLQSDRVARISNVIPNERIVPFRGDYFTLKESAQHLVKHLIYPVPDPRFPFLGVHFTRRINGEFEAGPNAVLALKREGYKRTSFSLRDTCETLSYTGFWRMAFRYWQTGLAEMWRAFSKKAFVKDLQRLVPEITATHVTYSRAGVRAQTLNSHGQLINDFCLLEREKMIHVLNAPSPAATASLAIAETIAERFLKNKCD